MVVVSSGHHSISLHTPIYSAAFITNQKLILGAGGGATKSGLKNKLTILELDTQSTKNHNLGDGDDVPMSIDYDRENQVLITGINSPLSTNLHLRTFSIEKDEFIAKTSLKVLNYQSDDHYQRITCLSDHAPKLLAIGGTNNQLEILNYPSLRPAFKTIWVDEATDLLAVDFHADQSQFLVGSNKSVKVYSTKRKLSKKGTKNISDPELLRAFVPPPLGASGSETTCSFRNVKYGRGSNASTIYTIVNHVPSKSKSNKKSVFWPKSDPRKAILIAWNLSTGQQIRSKTISHKPVTSLDISPLTGRYIAFSSSDLSIGILDGTSLRSLLSILHAHEFPVTAIKFSPDEKRVVSCSADMSIRVIELDHSIQDRSSKQFFYILLLASLLALIIAYLFNK
ncbi:hypothetical protein Pst134EB_008900 [Puccinia striiformis f. sp. tritici]|uniref:Uncharacterized protein n=1 Tax=Puccinia striiformis f. sp. tritici PST-78 TaxID=1165861 RepID=A0A0L0VI61_9BASI|nr:hypothetical protein Pst134EB_008900 [Puccinia striiformis f. sp. tritici]KNE98921.1 hypothetical protein PSTG_07766 [Puccinia striiformis f. sp. tritici PST-78]